VVSYSINSISSNRDRLSNGSDISKPSKSRGKFCGLTFPNGVSSTSRISPGNRSGISVVSPAANSGQRPVFQASTCFLKLADLLKV